MIERLMARPMPIPSAFVVKKGSKILLHFLFADALALIAHEDFHGLLVAAAGADAQHPLVFGHLVHRLQPVAGEVHHDLLDLNRIGLHGGNIRREFANDPARVRLSSKLMIVTASWIRSLSESPRYADRSFPRSRGPCEGSPLPDPPHRRRVPAPTSIRRRVPDL